MSRADIWFDAITNIREELVEEALSHRFRRRIPWGKYMGLAACLVLVVCVGWFGLLIAGGGMGGGSDFMNGSSGAVSGDTAPGPGGPRRGGRARRQSGFGRRNALGVGLYGGGAGGP